MSDITGTLTIVRPDGTRTMTWNGDAKDRKAAKQVFEEIMNEKTYFAYAMSGTSRTAQQVRSFSDIEEMEKKTGSVSATVQPALVGG